MKFELQGYMEVVLSVLLLFKIQSSATWNNIIINYEIWSLFFFLAALLNFTPMTQQHPEVLGLLSLTKLLQSRKRNTENDTELGGCRERFLLEAVKVVAMRPSSANTGTAVSVKLINCTSSIVPFLPPPPPPNTAFIVVSDQRQHLPVAFSSLYLPSASWNMELENEMISTSSKSSTGSGDYKVLILGAGGVAKSGKFQQWHFWGEGVNRGCEVHRTRMLFNKQFCSVLSCTWLRWFMTGTMSQLNLLHSEMF